MNYAIPSSLRKPILLLSAMTLCLFNSASADESRSSPDIPADHPLIYSGGYVERQWVNAPEGIEGVSLQFNRSTFLNGKGYGWDNPGTKIAFRTNASQITALLYFSANHASTSARNSIGIYKIDGKQKPGWTFQTQAKSIQRDPELLKLEFPAPDSPGFHNYEIVLPYGDSVEFLGLYTNEDAELQPFPHEEKLRYVAYGDSITHGFTSSRVDRSYPYLLAEEKDWDLVNLGFGGRVSNEEDAEIISRLEPDVLTILIGVNDWQGGRSLETYQTNITQFLDEIRSIDPTIPIYLITPLWVPPSWQPSRADKELESYRIALQELYNERMDPNLHLIEGPALIDHDPKYFDRVAVHPNDEGFAMMATRLSEKIESTRTQ